jgi:hypothetical protein
MSAKRKNKQPYIIFASIVGVMAILGGIIAFTSSRTIPTDTTLKSGVKGTTLVTVVCIKAPCPAQKTAANIAVTDANGKSTTTKANAEGKFEVKLVPGTYTVSAIGDSALTAPTQQVTVVKDSFTKITFNFSRSR